MEKIRLGRTGLLVTKTAFGALPIQRISKADAVKLVRRACQMELILCHRAPPLFLSQSPAGTVRTPIRGPTCRARPQ